jgi:hypothetical protein
LAGDARLEGMTVEVLDDFVEDNLAFLWNPGNKLRSLQERVYSCPKK